MVLTPAHIESLLQEILPEFGAFLVETHLNRDKRRLSVHVFVETDEGIQISQCAAISRRLGQSLDEQNLIEGPYELQVSSPGIDRPLKMLRQYKKNIGRKFQVTLRTSQPPQVIEGTLEAVEEATLVFRPANDAPVAIPFHDIAESKEVLPW